MVRSVRKPAVFFLISLLVAATFAPSGIAVAAGTIYVTTTGNVACGDPAGTSLQCALSTALGGTTIDFSKLSVSDPGYNAGTHVWTFSMAVTLGASGVTIDGYTAPGACPRSTVCGPIGSLTSAPSVRVRLDGASYASDSGINGFTLSGSLDTIRGLAITSWPANGIALPAGANQNSIAGNEIGLAPNGLPAGNGTGIQVESNNNLIGGSAPADNNTISANRVNYGIQIDNPGDPNNFSGWLPVSGNSIQGNYIGESIDGDAGSGNLGNKLDGIALLSRGTPGNCFVPTSTLIGGSSAGVRNTIGDNGVAGVLAMGCADATSSGDVVQGNYIGSDVSGEGLAPNGYAGIIFEGLTQAYIGGSAPGTQNLISGNGANPTLACQLSCEVPSGGIILGGARSITIDNNTVGIDAGGTTPLANTGDGVVIGPGCAGVAGAHCTGLPFTVFSTDTKLGTADNGNFIAGNGQNGVEIWGGSGNTVDNNTIGAGVGAVSMPNAANGVYAHDGAAAGIGSSALGNVIANNGRAGVLVGSGTSDSSTHVAITGNSIYGNGTLGIDLAPPGPTCTTSGAGPNDYLPCPLIQSASTTSVAGTVPEPACGACRVEVYAATNEADDGVPGRPTVRYGEGKTYIGSATANAGTGTWSITVPSGAVAAGQHITADATTAGATAETSEFAANVIVAVPTAAPVSRFVIGHDAQGTIFRWQVAASRGVAGFRLYAGKVRLNPRLIPVHAADRYHYRVPRETAGPYYLQELATSGRAIWIAGSAP